MGTTSFCLEKVGSFFTNESPTPPDYANVGIGSSIFNSGSYYLENEILRLPISWTWLDGDPNANFLLNTTTANGSYIAEYGLDVGSSLGSQTYFRELSAVGTKDNTFEVEWNAKVRIKRST